MILSLTWEQFAKLQSALSQAPGVKLEITSASEGVLTTSDVELGLSYNGSSELTVTVLKKLSIKAKMATESIIESKVTAMFDQFLTS